jgi:hypothetical protein
MNTKEEYEELKKLEILSIKAQKDLSEFRAAYSKLHCETYKEFKNLILDERFYERASKFYDFKKKLEKKHKFKFDVECYDSDHESLKFSKFYKNKFNLNIEE